MKLSVLYQSHRSKFISNLRARRVPLANSIAVFKGSFRFRVYDTPNAYPLKYDQNFVYLFGVEEIGFDGFIELGSARSFLVRAGEPLDGFVGSEKTKLDASDFKKWADDTHTSTPLTDAQVQSLYGIERIMSRAEFLEYLEQQKPAKIYLNHGIDRYTGTPSNAYDDPEVLEKFKGSLDRDTVYPVLNCTRTFKTASEVQFMRQICQISSQGHIDVMRACKPGVREHQIAAIFYVA